MQNTSITTNLNDRQNEAVCAAPQNCLVLAGAGSGKTRVLVHRIAYLMEAHHISAYEILAVTFTNKAAAEMKSRIEKLRGLPIQNMWVGTFHGLSHRLLRTHFKEAGLPQAFQIIDSDDQLRLIKRIHRAMDLDEKTWVPKKTQWFINHHKENGERANHLKFSRDDYTTQKLQKIYAEYELICERSGLVDFTELLLRAFELLQKNELIRDHYQKRFKHILVDEFQDTNSIQYRWLKLFSGEHAYLMAVGDDDQSIYSWRGAQIENIHQFSKDFKDSKVIRLEQNYRSTQNILNAANAVIDKNADRLGKTLWTESAEGSKITLFEAFNERDEATFVISEIKQMVRQGSALTDFAILYRSNAQSRILEEYLIDAKLPYRIYGGFKFFDRAEIKDALAYLRLMANRHDDAAFERVVNTPTRGIGQTTLSKLRELANENSASLWDATQYCFDNNIFSKRAAEALQVFINLINNFNKDTRELKLAELVDHVLSETNLLNFYEQDKTEKGLSKAENLKELISATSEFTPKAEHENLSLLDAFLSEIILDTGDEQADTNAESVSLMTLHAAKGLEFPVIFMVGMEENLFPHPMSVAERGLEEERRLCYVGMTRAMKKLFLSCAETRNLYGQSNYSKPSRFISEIPDELLHRVRPSLTPTRPPTYQPNYQATMRQTRTPIYTKKNKDSGLSVGDQVKHPKFGAGTVLGHEGQGEHARIQIKFEEHGTKWLVLQYANLSV